MGISEKKQERAQIEQIKREGLTRIIAHNILAEGVTVCYLLKDGQVITRGLAILSPKDILSRRRGRILSTARALRAVKRWEPISQGEDSPELDTQPICTTRYLNTPEDKRYEKVMRLYEFKSSVLPTLNDEERNLISQTLRSKTDEENRRAKD